MNFQQLEDFYDLKWIDTFLIKFSDFNNETRNYLEKHYGENNQ